MSIFDLGDPVPLTLNVTIAGVPTDATTTVVTVRQPDGTSITPTVVHAGVGSYTATFTPTLAGAYVYNWVTTGTGAGAENGAFTVVDPFAADSWAQIPDLVSALIPQRTLDPTGAHEAGFSNTTVPTAAQVRLIAAGVADETEDSTGTIPPALADAFASVIALETASRVELGFFDDDDKASKTSTSLHERYVEALANLVRAIANVDNDGTVTPAGAVEPPAGTFPTPYPDWCGSGFVDASTMNMRF